MCLPVSFLSFKEQCQFSKLKGPVPAVSPYQFSKLEGTVAASVSLISSLV